jgi:hypothetical protein
LLSRFHRGELKELRQCSDADRQRQLGPPACSARLFCALDRLYREIEIMQRIAARSAADRP